MGSSVRGESVVPVNAADYFEVGRLVRWLDIDPSFDINWITWAKLRPYAFVPDLQDLMADLGPPDYAKLRHCGNELHEKSAEVPGYNGPIKIESLTTEQIRFASGNLTIDSGHLRPVRLDKALATIYGINRELERLKKPLIAPTIIVSAFNLKGVRKPFNLMEKPAKEKLRIDLAKALDQPENLASEFLKGRKVSFDVAARAYEFLSKRKDFGPGMPKTLALALETPTQHYAPASESEEFDRGRLTAIPPPFSRPKKSRPAKVKPSSPAKPAE